MYFLLTLLAYPPNWLIIFENRKPALGHIHLPYLLMFAPCGFVCMYTDIYAHVCVCTCVYMHICVYKHIWNKGETPTYKHRDGRWRKQVRTVCYYYKIITQSYNQHDFEIIYIKKETETKKLDMSHHCSLKSVLRIQFNSANVSWVAIGCQKQQLTNNVN